MRFARLSATGGAGDAPAATGPFTVTCEIEPRLRDSDTFGHVNNAVFITYLEVARQAYWQRLRPDFSYTEVPFIMAHVTCNFRSEALVEDVLEVRLRCGWIGGKSFSFEYEIRDKATGRLVVDAETIQVCYDYEAKTSIPMPPDLKRDVEALEGRTLDRPS